MESVKGKRKMKSWGYQSSAPASGGDSFSPQQMGKAIITSIKNRMDKQEMDKDDVLHDWQEFIFMRQEKIDRKLQSGDGASEHIMMKNQVNELLKDQPAEVSDAVTMLVLSATYIHYNKGFADGMKIGMIIGNL